MGLYAINFVAIRPLVLRPERKTRATIMAAVTSMEAVTVFTIFGTTTNTQVIILPFPACSFFALFIYLFT